MFNKHSDNLARDANIKLSSKTYLKNRVNLVDLVTRLKTAEKKEKKNNLILVGLFLVILVASGIVISL